MDQGNRVRNRGDSIFMFLFFRLCTSISLCKELNQNINNDFVGKGLVEGCEFRRTTTYNSDGGSIYISGIKVDLIVILCNFWNCIASGYGGAIYFNSDQVFINKVCGYQCYSTSKEYQFAYLKTLSTMNNVVELFSISSCPPDMNNAKYSSFELYSGIQSALYVNSTRNFLTQFSGMSFMYPETNQCKFSLVAHCLDYYTSTVFGWGGNGLRIYSYTSIINNTQNTQNHGIVTIWSDYNCEFSNSVLSENGVTLFRSLATCVVRDCIINHDSNKIGISLSTGNQIFTQLAITRIQYVYQCGLKEFSFSIKPNRSIFFLFCHVFIN